jgi:hypothetical protein
MAPGFLSPVFPAGVGVWYLGMLDIALPFDGFAGI